MMITFVSYFLVFKEPFVTYLWLNIIHTNQLNSLNVTVRTSETSPGDDQKRLQ